MKKEEKTLEDVNNKYFKKKEFINQKSKTKSLNQFSYDIY